MAIAILVGRDEAEKKQYDWFISQWKQALLALQADLDIRIWPELGNPAEITFACVWNHALGALNTLPNLKVIASLAAGVDHLFADTHLPANCAIVRVTDPYMKNDIVQYVVAYVLNHIKRIDHWQAMQKQKNWSKQPPFNYSEKTVGVMGVGYLGSKAIAALNCLGLNVIGWSNSEKNLQDIKHFTGKNQLDEFLSLTDILICMLPLTNSTKDILNKNTFALLPQDAYLINVGRGGHLVEQDLLDALEKGKLSGAVLDVFKQEPLPSNHEFWSQPNIRVTPHIASVTNALTAAPQVLDNYQRLLSGQDLMNKVDVNKGY